MGKCNPNLSQSLQPSISLNNFKHSAAVCFVCQELLFVSLQPTHLKDRQIVSGRASEPRLFSTYSQVTEEEAWFQTH